MPLLRVEQKHEKPFEVELDKEAFTIGRSSANDLTFNNLSLSRHHARITLGAWVATLVDRGSKNGTKVNGRLIKKPVELQDGDELTFGQVSARYQMERRNSDSTLAL